MSRELFARVQAVLDRRLPKAGERQRKHHHYLKSTVWCGRCHGRGVASRLILMPVTGRGGKYRYFLCRARQDHACDAPYIRIEDAEAAVLRHYATLRLPDGFAARVRQVLEATLADEESSARLVHAHLTKTLRDLDAKENNLLGLVETGGTIALKVKSHTDADEPSERQAAPRGTPSYRL